MTQKLDLVWSAHFADGTCIHQFDDTEQTVEHKFQEVQAKEKAVPLSRFLLFNVRTGTSYWADLERGRIIVEPIETGVKACPASRQEPEPEVAGDPNQRYRLIYFRRVQRTFEQSGTQIAETSCMVTYFLGYQHTVDGKNVKRIVNITKADEVFLT